MSKLCGAIALVSIILSLPTTSHSSELCDVLRGAVLIAQDDRNTFLGSIESEHDSDSIFNDYGDYGGEYSDTSIWNKYGDFGGEYSEYSPFNSYSSGPPMLIKGNKIIGYLTVNNYINDGVSPYIVKGMCYRNL